MSLRIALKTEEPLPALQCMYPVLLGDKNDLTIRDLLKRIKNDLKLEVASSSLSLWLDDFQFLPWLQAKDLLREDEIISVRKLTAATTGRKRRAEEEVEEEGKGSSKLSKKSKKTRKESKNQAEKKKVEAKEAEKEQKIKEEKKKKDKKDKKKKKKEDEIKKDKIACNIMNRGKPYEGTRRTRKRNERRKKVKQIKRQQQQQLKQQQQAREASKTQQEPEQQVNYDDLSVYNAYENAYYYDYPSSGHIYFDQEEYNQEYQDQEYYGQAYHETEHPEQQEAVEESYAEKEQAEQLQEEQEPAKEGVKETEATGNRQAVAIITEHEANPDYKGAPVDKTRYPVQTSGSVIRVDAEKPPEEVKTYNYDEMREASFTQAPTPREGELLAIKTMEITENYTPEISDWKHVKVIQVDPEARQVAVEILPEFVKKRIKGKFDLTVNDEEEEAEEETTRTYDFADFVAIKFLT